MSRTVIYLHLLVMLVLSICAKRSAAFVAKPSTSQSLSKSPTALSGWFTEMVSSFSTATESSSASKYYTIGLTGSGGLVGTALRDELSKRGSIKGKPVRVIRLVRGIEAEEKDLSATEETDLTLKWNPNGKNPNEIVNSAAVASMDAIIHLSGENVATGLGPLGFLGIRPWTDAKKKEILDSRVVTTKALSEVLAISTTPKSFLSASGVGVYGDQFVGEGVEAADESTDISSTRGFLAEISRKWEAATSAAADNNKVRVVNMRLGVQMSIKGGALAKLYPIFFLGGGGNVGSGQQYFPFISARDNVRAIVHALETPSLKGPVNFCSPEVCTNAEFTKAFGKVLNRPTILPFPSFAVNTLFGEMGNEMLLGGTRAMPTKLLQSGFQFEHASIKDALQSAVDEYI
mmetsp:Transcript_2556/g.3406  ORF Transcript_2556/g.3406 Transcript_2556/m.3406 type:complete len:403 (-) Transcript_2556:189-1397(-)